ncbi:MAG: hypothetical protein DWQ10_13405 [Calditrichaeota bacterium]|nr:MAG: hypothetical protein DWQ10_13405 [Calditrichota bacterium]
MLTLYLSCLIFGGILLAVSLFMGGDGDLGSDMELDSDLESDIETGGEGLLNAFRFFSFRNAIYFITFFGLTGSTISRLAFPQFVTLLAALFMGLFAASLGHIVMEYLKKSQVGQGESMESLEGRTATVVLQISRNNAGKISLRMNDTTHQMLAHVSDVASLEEFNHGDNVIITHIENGYAYVAEESFIE